MADQSQDTANTDELAGGDSGATNDSANSTIGAATSTDGDANSIDTGTASADDDGGTDANSADAGGSSADTDSAGDGDSSTDTDSASDGDSSTGTDSAGDGASSTDTGSTDSGSPDANAASPGAEGSPSDSGAGTATGDDPGQPYLFVDRYSGDDGRLTGKKPDWTTLAGTANYVGAILKAWDGVKFNDGGWFARHWPAVRAAGGDNYGKRWFRGAYLFLEFTLDGAAQADAYLAAVDGAGGWADGDILPIIDVEQGGATHPNHGAGKQQVVDCATACANRVRQVTGRRVIVYGLGALRDLGISDKLGCDLVWNPAYTPQMVVHGLEAFALEDIVLWQYCGDGQAAISTLPHTVPNFGPCDLSVFVKGAQKPTLQMVRDNLLT